MDEQKSFAYILSRIHTSKEIKFEYPPEISIIDKIVPEQGYTVFYGDTGSFKTLLLMEAFVDISLGLPFLGHPTEKSNVLYIDAEMGHRQFLERIRWLLKGKGITFSEWENTDAISLHKELLTIDNQADMNLLKELIRKYDINVIIFDPLSYFHSRNENSSADMNLIVRALSEIMGEFKVTIILAHHTSKLPIQYHSDTEEEQNLYRKSLSRGSSVLLAAAHSAVCVKRPYKESEIRLYFEKLKFEKEEPNKSVKLIFTEDENHKTTSVKFEEFTDAGIDKYGKTTDEIFNWIVVNDIEKFTTPEVKKYLKEAGLPHSDGAVGNALKNLIGRKLIEREQGKGTYVITDIMREVIREYNNSKS